jgi:hypothetical protein
LQAFFSKKLLPGCPPEKWAFGLAAEHIGRPGEYFFPAGVNNSPLKF